MLATPPFGASRSNAPLEGQNQTISWTGGWWLSNDEQRVMTWSRLDIYIVGILSRGDELPWKSVKEERNIFGSPK